VSCLRHSFAAALVPGTGPADHVASAAGPGHVVVQCDAVVRVAVHASAEQHVVRAVAAWNCFAAD
jgi:hypothetical protein